MNNITEGCDALHLCVWGWQTCSKQDIMEKPNS